MLRRTLAVLLVLLLAVGVSADGIHFERASVPSTGGVISNPAGNDTAPLGTEMLTNGSFASDLSGWTATGWTWTAGSAKHDSGNTNALSQSVSVTNGQLYQIEFTSANYNTGIVAVTLGAVTLYTERGSNFGANGVYLRTIVAATSGSVSLSFTPTSAYTGDFDTVSLKPVTTLSDAVLDLRDSTGGSFAAFRGRDTPGANLGIGNLSLSYLTTGQNNAAGGYRSQRNTTTGIDNTSWGFSSLILNTTGSYNTAVGANSQYNNVNGWNNVSVGAQTLYSNLGTGGGGYYNSTLGYAGMYLNTEGTFNISVGTRSLYSNTTASFSSGLGAYSLFSSTGGSNTAVGAYSGTTSGSTPSVANAVTTGSSLTFVGAYSGLGSTTQRTNATAVGFEAYVDASNRVVLGDENIIDVLAGSAAQASVGAKTITFTATLFSALGTPANGTLAYCSDCLIQATCAGSGTGALAKRLNGAWVCN